GIKAGGSLWVLNSTIAGNTAHDLGGGISAGGIVDHGFAAPGTVVIRNSTISHNHAGSVAGGVFVDADPLTITDTTIAGNDTGGQGGGLVALPLTSPSEEAGTISGTILAGN